MTYTAIAFYPDHRPGDRLAYEKHGFTDPAVAYAHASAAALPYGGKATVTDSAGRRVEVAAEGLLAAVPEVFRTDETLLDLAEMSAERSGPMRPGETFMTSGQRRDQAHDLRRAMWRVLVDHPVYNRVGVKFIDANDAAWVIVHLLVAAAVVRAGTDTGQAVA
jgi:hypothetical protein